MNSKFLTLGLIAVFTGSVLAFSGCTVSVQPTPDTGPGIAPSQLDIGFFYDQLSPYGEWLQLEGHGWVWTPNQVPYGWRPYTDGHWVYTEYGWTWVSDWEWGWAPFH